MNEHAIRKMLEGGGGLSGALLRAGLWFPGKVYGGLMELRRTAYLCGLLSSSRAPVPVISIGNLTAGGSGKTPFTIRLAQTLAKLGRKPGILLRGYRRSASGLSDEAVLYQTRCPEAVVEVGSDRRASAARAVARGADVLLMDDGFQHLKLWRDLDIVLVDATSPWGGGNTIPGGLLREPKSTLRKARVVVITRSDQAEAGVVEKIKTEIQRIAPYSLVLTACHKPSRLLRLDNTELPLSRLDGKRVVALSGIARPEAFERTLRELGAEVVASMAGRDHSHFDNSFMDKAFTLAREHDAVVATTEKDRAKQIFSYFADNNVEGTPEIWTLGIEQEIDGMGPLVVLVTGVIGGHGGGGA